MRILALCLTAVLLLAPVRTSAAQADSVRFSEDVLPLLQGDLAPVLDDVPGLTTSSWDGLVAGAEFGQVLVPFDAEHSLLVQLAEAADALDDAEVDLLVQWIDEGARSDAGAIPFADADGPYLYVTNQADAMVSVIDMDENVVVRNVKLQPLGFDANAKPHHTAVDPDGSHWYVSLIGANKVLKFNKANELVAQADFEAPGMLARHPTEDLLYVGRSMTAVNPPQRIGMIRPSDMSIEEIGVFFPRPHALAINPAGGFVYSASLAENRIASLPVGAEDVAELVLVDGPVHTFVQFAVSPDGQTLAVGGQLTGDLLIFDLSTPEKPELVKTLDVGGMPWHPAFTPDGHTLYVGNQGANTVTAVNMDTREVAAVIDGEGLAEPHGLAVSPDGRYVYVSNRNLKSTYIPRALRGMRHEGMGHEGMPHDDAAGADDGMMGMDMDAEAEYNGTVVVIDTATNEIVRVLEIGKWPAGMSN